MSVAVTILGCGSSAGVPRVGQGWGACDPTNPKNRRRRCALLVEKTNTSGAKTQVLIDMGPDLRAQLLDYGIGWLDGILLTHAHADHTHGIDEVRPLVLMQKRRIDLYMDAATSATLHEHFGYIFTTPPGSYYPPLLNDKRLTPGEAVTIDGPGGGIAFVPFRLTHGEIDSLGFRIGDFAYTPDLNGIPPESEVYLRGLELWIVDALRYTPHPSHFSVADALDWVGKLRPTRAILTNLHTDLDFAQLQQKLPPGVEPAYDGLRIDPA